jgi:hypothetical protein
MLAVPGGGPGIADVTVREIAFTTIVGREAVKRGGAAPALIEGIARLENEHADGAGELRVIKNSAHAGGDL